MNTEYGYKITICDCDGDHKDEVNKVIDFLNNAGATWSQDVTSECYGGDYYVGGGLQAIDVTLSYITFSVKEEEIFNELVKHAEEWDFVI